MAKKILSAILALALVFTFTVTASAASTEAASAVGGTAEQSAVLTFSEGSVTETSAGSGYTIDGIRGLDRRRQGAERRDSHFG